MIRFHRRLYFIKQAHNSPFHTLPKQLRLLNYEKEEEMEKKLFIHYYEH